MEYSRTSITGQFCDRIPVFTPTFFFSCLQVPLCAAHHPCTLETPVWIVQLSREQTPIFVFWLVVSVHLLSLRPLFLAGALRIEERDRQSIWSVPCQAAVSIDIGIVQSRKLDHGGLVGGKQQSKVQLASSLCSGRS